MNRYLKHITRGLAAGAPTALLSALLSGKGSKLRNALLYGGLASIGTAAGSVLFDKDSDEQPRNASIKTEPTKSATPPDQTSETDPKHSISPTQQRLLNLSYGKREPGDVARSLLYGYFNSTIDKKAPKSPAESDRSKENKPTTPRRTVSYGSALESEAAAHREQGKILRRYVTKPIAETWNGIFSKEDHGLPRKNPIQYMKFLGSLAGERFSNIWHPAQEYTDKGLAAAEKTERKQHKLNKELIDQARRSNVLVRAALLKHVNDTSMSPAHIINDATALTLNPSNPGEYREALSKGTARTDLSKQYYAERNKEVEDIGKGLGMSPGNLQAARLGMDVLVNMFADPLSAGSNLIAPGVLRVMANPNLTRTVLKSPPTTVWSKARAGAKWLAEPLPEVATELLDYAVLPTREQGEDNKLRAATRLVQYTKERLNTNLSPEQEQSLIEYFYNFFPGVPIADAKEEARLENFIDNLVKNR